MFYIGQKKGAVIAPFFLYIKLTFNQHRFTGVICNKHTFLKGKKKLKGEKNGI